MNGYRNATVKAINEDRQLRHNGYIDMVINAQTPPWVA